MVRVYTGWPRNYDLDFVGEIEDIRTDIVPEDEGLPYREQHRFGIKLAPCWNILFQRSRDKENTSRQTEVNSIT